MKSLAKKITSFNQSDTVLVISKYPYKDNPDSHHGVATYTQHQLETISKQTGQRFVVLVQKEYQRKAEVVGNGKILVVPAFSGFSKMYLELISWVRTFNKATIIHIHSEYYTSGNIIQMATAIPFYQTLQMMGKKVYYTAHNVVIDFSFMARHLGKKRTDPLLKWSERLLPYYYRLLEMNVSKLILLDISVKQKIEKMLGKSNKFVLSPHWIYPKRSSKKVRQIVRKKLGFNNGDLVLVCFGFMTRYKGVDWLVDAVSKAQQNGQTNIKLILAGGRAPSQKGKKHYEQFYNELTEKVANCPTIHLTGFIPEAEVSSYFAASDIVVLPYRGILGASGSWAQAMAHGKPFIISKELESYLSDEDTKMALTANKLTTDDIVFKRNSATFSKLLLRLDNEQTRSKLATFSKKVARSRSPKIRIEAEYESLYQNNRTNIFEQTTAVLQKATVASISLAFIGWKLLFSR